MKQVFADTCFWVAILDTQDQHHLAARRADEELKKHGPVLYITTEFVLGEVLNLFSRFGEGWRLKAAEAVNKILQNPNVRVFPQTRDLFVRSVSFYKSRLDKESSFIDCVSMQVMNENAITEVLSSDHHFEQEGFTRLIHSM
ncbi:MAG: PIN domain-containing protein [bacterium]